jgi:hypothetical protein
MWTKDLKFGRWCFVRAQRRGASDDLATQNSSEM